MLLTRKKKMACGQVSSELEIGMPASFAWELYGTLQHVCVYLCLILVLFPTSTLEEKTCNCLPYERRIPHSTTKKIVVGHVSSELEIQVPASFAWELYGTLQLQNLIEKELPNTIENIEVEEGDGGVGTVFKITFPPGTGLTTYKEIITKLDNEKLVKETEGVEGGFMDLGFTLYRVRFQVFKKHEDSCIIRSTIEYKLKEEYVANASYVDIESLINIAKVAKTYLVNKYTN